LLGGAGKEEMTGDEKALSAMRDFAVEIAMEAGEITLKYFRKSCAVATKRDGSFVTQADCEAEAHLRQRIRQRFPDDAILGEEEKDHPGISDRRWIIDPIDGTFSFVHGVPMYGVLVGLEIAGEAVVGVIHLPATAEVISAARGLGCFWNDERGTVSKTQSLDQALVLSTHFEMCERYGFGAPAAEIQKRAKATRTWGDCYGHAMVATGRAEVMLDPVMNVWDCAPLLPIMQEAGGTFTSWKGEATIHGGNAISTNGVLFDEVMEIVANF
jgi:histidinol-phosphatase